MQWPGPRKARPQFGATNQAADHNMMPPKGGCFFEAISSCVAPKGWEDEEEVSVEEEAEGGWEARSTAAASGQREFNEFGRHEEEEGDRRQR